MAHFAKLNENNTVDHVLVVVNDVITDSNGNESEQLGIDFLKSLYGEDTRWIQTSYNGSFRKNYAGSGYVYDSVRDAFIPPKPWDSWVLNEYTCMWDPPIPYPNDPQHYIWNEEGQQWVMVEDL